MDSDCKVHNSSSPMTQELGRHKPGMYYASKGNEEEEGKSRGELHGEGGDTICVSGSSDLNVWKEAGREIICIYGSSDTYV